MDPATSASVRRDVSAIDDSEELDRRLTPFSTEPFYLGVDKYAYQQVLPTGGVNGTQITFQVPSESGGWTALHESYVHLRLRLGIINVQTNDITPMTLLNYDHTPETNFMDLLWSDVRLFLDSTEVSDEQSRLYPWQAFVRMLLQEKEGYGASEVCQTIGVTTAPLISGAAINTDLINTSRICSTSTNAERGGWREFVVLGSHMNPEYDGRIGASGQRATLFWRLHQNTTYDNGNPTPDTYLDLVFRPRIGFWQQKSYLPPSTSIRLELSKGPDTLPWRAQPRLTTDPMVYRGYIDWSQSEATLLVKKVYPSAATREELSASLLSSPAIYPFVRSRVQMKTYDPSITSVAENMILAGPRPDLVVVQFIDARSTLKAYDVNTRAGCRLSPFFSGQHLSAPSAVPGFFQPCPSDSRSIVPTVNAIQLTYGDTVVPLVEYRMQSERERAEAYDAYRRACADSGAPCLSYGAYCANYTVFCFDLTKNETHMGDYSSRSDDRGSISIRATLTQQGAPNVAGPLPGFSMICTAFNNATILISADRSIRRVGF